MEAEWRVAPEARGKLPRWNVEYVESRLPESEMVMEIFENAELILPESDIVMAMF